MPADVKEDPLAWHGFINRISAVSLMGVGYDHGAAADAIRRILAFFDTHLREALPNGG